MYLIRNQLQKVISCFIIATLTVVFSSNAQTKYWIGFKDKSNLIELAKPCISIKTAQQRKMLGLDQNQFTDRPVNVHYIDSLKKLNVHILIVSRWLNSVSAYLNQSELDQIRKLDFVSEVVPVAGFLVPSKVKSDELFTAALADLGADVFVTKGIDASGVEIGVIDAGFYDADREEGVAHLFLSEKVLGTRDYLDTLRPISYTKKVSDLDDHGTEVLKCLGGFDISANLKYGLATDAKYYLARTDHGKFENRAEEDKWIAAMEWMDSLGVRLINSSLGYSTGFDLLDENYKPHQMDGKTSKISKAAQIATEEKGMIVVVSAGNEGDKPNWLVLTAPADAKGVIAVGAVKPNRWEKVSHSSIGPEWIPYVKPDVSAFSLRGTSFSAPLITGFVGCLLQLDSTLSGKKLKDILLKSGHLYPYGNNFIGYGVPQAKKAIELINGGAENSGNIVYKKVFGKKMNIDFDSSETIEGVIFRKKNERFVIRQEVFAAKNGKLSYKRIPGEKFTTFQIGEVIMEFEWQD